MAYAEPPLGRWRRLLGGPNSWRRVVLGGVGAGLVVAFVAALAASFIGDSESSSLDPVTPTVAAPGVAPDAGDDVPPPAGDPPGDEPPAPDEPADDQPQPTEPPDQPAPTEPPPATQPPPTAPLPPTATPQAPEPTPASTP